MCMSCTCCTCTYMIAHHAQHHSHFTQPHALHWALHKPHALHWALTLYNTPTFNTIQYTYIQHYTTRHPTPPPTHTPHHAPPHRSLPRVGLSTTLGWQHGRVTWYGRGPHECYPDRKSAADVGRYSMGVEGMHVPYIVPGTWWWGLGMCVYGVLFCRCVCGGRGRGGECTITTRVYA